MKMMKTDTTNIQLYREVNYRVRYYSIRVYKTLFRGYLLEKKFGSLKNKRPTGVIKEYYDNIDQAVLAITKIVILKLKRGYRNDECQIRD